MHALNHWVSWPQDSPASWTRSLQESVLDASIRPFSQLADSSCEHARQLPFREFRAVLQVDSVVDLQALRCSNRTLSYVEILCAYLRAF